jgi:hypothetical protein
MDEFPGFEDLHRDIGGKENAYLTPIVAPYRHFHI